MRAGAQQSEENDQDIDETGGTGGTDIRLQVGAIELAKHGFFEGTSVVTNGLKGAYLIRSDVTGKNRIVLAFYGTTSRIPCMVTLDVRDKDNLPQEQFVRNLFDFFDLAQAGEWFIPIEDGQVEYLLTNKDGDILRVAAADVACDYTKPDGYTKELEAGMSCCLCHGPYNGYRTTHNDLEFMLGAEADFFGDATYKSRAGKVFTRSEVLAVVAGRFAERIDEPDGILGRARRDYVKAAGSLTDYRIDGTNALVPIKDLEKAGGIVKIPSNASPAQLVAAKIKEIYHGYRYRDIDPQRACLELGVKCDASQAKKELKRLVPTVKGTREDELIAFLKNGASIKRDDMDAIFPEMARRAAAVRSTETQNAKPVPKPDAAGDAKPAPASR